MHDFSQSFEIIRHWDNLPDDAVVSAKITALVLGCAERIHANGAALTKQRE